MASNIQLLSYKPRHIEDKFVYYSPPHPEDNQHEDDRNSNLSSDNEEEEITSEIHSSENDHSNQVNSDALSGQSDNSAEKQFHPVEEASFVDDSEENKEFHPVEEASVVDDISEENKEFHPVEGASVMTSVDDISEENKEFHPVEAASVVDPQRPIILSAKVKRLGQYSGNANGQDYMKEVTKVINYMKAAKIKGRKSRVTIFQNCITVKLKHNASSGMDESNIYPIEGLKGIYTFKELEFILFLVFLRASSLIIVPLKFQSKALSEAFFNELQVIRKKNRDML